MFKFIISAIVALTVMVVPAQAQKLSPEQVRQGLAEMRTYKHAMLVKELDLEKDQEQKFFDVYDKMDDELMAIGVQMRKIEQDILSQSDPSDAECKSASRMLFEQKKKESEIELRYYDRLAEVLTPQQLVKLKSTERRITMNMAKYHGRKSKK